MAAQILRIAIAGMLLVGAGCQEDLTEVVVAIQSDLAPGTEVDTIGVNCQAGNSDPPAFSGCLGASLDVRTSFPLSAGFASTDDGPASFSITVQMTKFNGLESLIVVSRKATAIQFVREQTLMLVLPMLRACACQGTACPNPGANPDCDDLVDPQLVPLDPVLAPRGPAGGPMNFAGPATRPGVGGGSAGLPPP